MTPRALCYRAKELVVLQYQQWANASAVIYSMLQSAKANELPLIQWLTYVLEQLPRCTNDDQRRALLPHRFDIQRLENDA